MEKKKIYYKYAEGFGALEALRKEGGDNPKCCLDNDEDIFYMPYNGGAIECTPSICGVYVMDHGERINIDPNADILSESEREYLSSVCRPFLKDVECISKIISYKSSRYCCLHVDMNDGEGFFLPKFDRYVDMFQGMIMNEHYTPKELKLE